MHISSSKSFEQSITYGGRTRITESTKMTLFLNKK